MQMRHLTKYSVDLLRREDQRKSSPTWSLFSWTVCLKCRFSATQRNKTVALLIIFVGISVSLAVFLYFVNEPSFLGLTCTVLSL